jgi:hypothetical protein
MPEASQAFHQPQRLSQRGLMAASSAGLDPLNSYLNGLFVASGINLGSVPRCCAAMVSRTDNPSEQS